MPYIPALWPVYLALYALAFCLGAVLASFVNVVVYRLPRGLSFARGRSFCPGCSATLTAQDLVPIFSWLFLRGRCRHCGAPISGRYALGEALGGLLAVLALWREGLTWRFLAALGLLLVLLAIALIDWDTMEIPDGLQLCLCLPTVALVILSPQVSLLQHAIGALCVSAPMLLMAYVIPDSFGGGDVKLMAICGAALGWKLILLALFFALISGGGYGVWLLLSGRAKKGAHMPFGPFLALGVAAALLFGDPVLGWYLGLF